MRGTPVGLEEGGLPAIILKNTKLIIINVATGESVAEYKGDIGSIIWSADGSRVLYLDARSHHHFFGYGFRLSPCIFNIQTFQNGCLTSIPHTHIPLLYELFETGIYSWSSDGNSIRYVYLYFNNQTLEQAGNICTYNLMNGNISCPTENLIPPHVWGISYYNFSPDGQFISFCYEDTLSLYNHNNFGNDALIAVDGNNLTTWTGNDEYGFPSCSYERQIWRPLP